MDSIETREYLYKDSISEEESTRNTFNYNVSRLIETKINPNVTDYKYFTDEYTRHENYYYTTDKFNPYFDKFNMSSFADILLNLFFQKINFSNVYNSKKLPPNSKYKKDFIFNDYIYGIISRNFTYNLRSIQNLNDINILKQLIYDYIIPLPEIQSDTVFIDGIKRLLFNPISECGLLATDYGLIPLYELSFLYLKNLNENYEDKYELFKKLLDENIGNSDVLTLEEYKISLNKNLILSYIGADVIEKLKELKYFEDTITYDNITYDSWELAVVVELLLNRSINKSYSHILIPSENSTLFNPYIYIRETTETTVRDYKIKKWYTSKFDFDNTVFQNTVEYNRALANLKSNPTIFTEIISDKQDNLDKCNLRVIALEIVKSIDPNAYNLRKVLPKTILPELEFIELVERLDFTEDNIIDIHEYLKSIDVYIENKEEIRNNIKQRLRQTTLTQKQVKYINRILKPYIQQTIDKNRLKLYELFKNNILTEQEIRLTDEEINIIKKSFETKTVIIFKDVLNIVNKLLQKEPSYKYNTVDIDYIINILISNMYKVKRPNVYIPPHLRIKQKYIKYRTKYLQLKNQLKL